MTIDWWTLAIQTINVLILVWLLARFFWRPVAAMIEERRQTAARILDDAEKKRAEAEAAEKAVAETRAGFAAERDTLLEAARAEAESLHRKRLAEADRDAAARIAKAEAAARDAHQAEERAWFDRAGDLALSIAGRLAGRLDPAVIAAAFLDGLVAEIARLPDAAKAAAALPEAELELVSAAPLGPALAETAQQRLREALGTTAALNLRVDAALIAGFELHGPHFVVGNNWREDLARIGQELRHDRRS
ncbi:hypothetical protein L2U69_18285 [Zavarzinia compransoris]|uniref:F0F1 ATP synthase subunit B family protein n=1 Tax=Zavarzinia marina TaxID=2911065 RepID=UPI001F21531C|nr:hypothetical protein [Zavarzinia marina]MCF4167600.1 hypothetical protein [Zavarzinia marina]